jgi:ParE toxin of type II toxin-antitoxin system, parDE
MDIRFLDIAQRELDEAVEYYNAESPGLGDQFLLEVLSTLQRIRQYPSAWHPFTQNTRRCQTRRFPYGVVYQILESETSSSRWPICTGSQGIGRTGCSSHAEQGAAVASLQFAVAL